MALLPDIEEKIIDMRGQICPSTLLTALREVNQHKLKLRSREIRLVCLTDNRNAVGTIPDVVKNMGYEVVISKDQDGGYRITINGGA